MGVKVLDGATWKTVTAPAKFSIDGGTTWRTAGAAHFYDPITASWMRAVDYSLAPPSALTLDAASQRSGTFQYTWTHSPSSFRSGYQVRTKQGAGAFSAWADIGDSASFGVGLSTSTAPITVVIELRTVWTADGITWVTSSVVTRSDSSLPMTITGATVQHQGGANILLTLLGVGTNNEQTTMPFAVQSSNGMWYIGGAPPATLKAGYSIPLNGTPPPVGPMQVDFTARWSGVNTPYTFTPPLT